MGDILVVGLAGRQPSDNWSPLLANRTVVARYASAASRALPARTNIAMTWDAVFELIDPPHVASVIADGLVELAATQNVAYLTPGFGSSGDAIVDRLGLIFSELSIVPGHMPDLLRCSGPMTIIDSIELAAAGFAEPFVGGIPALDSTTAVIITNWYGDQTISRALERLAERGFSAEVHQVDNDGFLYIPASDPTVATGSLAALEHIVARLRRNDGCPWDREQTAQSLLPALAEEADELRQAIEAGDTENIVEELGDVLVNLLMQAQIATEAGEFRFSDAITSATRKLIRRHPHVFGDATAGNSDDVLAIWKQVKANEKRERSIATTRS